MNRQTTGSESIQCILHDCISTSIQYEIMSNHIFIPTIEIASTRILFLEEEIGSKLNDNFIFL